MVRSSQGNIIFDITRNCRVPNASRYYEHLRPRERSIPKIPTIPDIFGDDCRIASWKESERIQIDDNEHHRASTVADPESGPVPQNSENGSDHDDMHDGESEQSCDEEFGSVGDSMSMESAEESETGDDSGGSQVGNSSGGFFQWIPVPVYNDDAASPDWVDDENFAGGNFGSADTALSEPEENSSGRQEDEPCGPLPVLYFSETTIYLIPNAFDPVTAVVCRAPLGQLFVNVTSAGEVFDRFNLVKYIPEHGLVVAASQKGRALVITLTQFQHRMFFRVDQIVPFKGQEEHGERPLRPLLGMAVSPMQGFEMPPDVPYIPIGMSDLRRFAFRYRVNRNDEGSGYKDDSEGSNSSIDDDEEEEEEEEEESRLSDHDGQDEGDMEERSPSAKRQPTLPECHAEASRVYQPNEPWRSWCSSRRYRLILLYYDQSVMSYDFWYSSEDDDDGGND